MYSSLLLFHSAVRYFVLIFLIIVVVRSFIGWSKKSNYSAMDNKLSTWMVMLTHTQFILGLTLYFFSPFVKFSNSTMKDSDLRYWTVEHISMMLIAVVLITVGRATAKKLADDIAKHKRMFIFNTLALVIIIAAIFASGRGFFTLRM